MTDRRDPQAPDRRTEPRQPTEDELLVLARAVMPGWAAQEADAAHRLRDVISSGDPARVQEGAQAMADWIDARVAMLVYYDLQTRSGPE